MRALIEGEAIGPLSVDRRAGAFFIGMKGDVGFSVVKDSPDGVLYIAESGRNIPFEIKRVYFIDRVSASSVRGHHAHKKLQQVIFCLRGSCEIESYDGKRMKREKLKKGEKGFYVGPKIWHWIYNFSKDCLLVVFASDYYDENDYVRNFQDFRKMA